MDCLSRTLCVLCQLIKAVLFKSHSCSRVTRACMHPPRRSELRDNKEEVGRKLAAFLGIEVPEDK